MNDANRANSIAHGQPWTVAGKTLNSRFFLAEALEIGERHVCEVDAPIQAVAHRAPDDLVRIAKRHTLAHQVIHEVGGGGEAACRGLQ